MGSVLYTAHSLTYLRKGKLIKKFVVFLILASTVFFYLEAQGLEQKTEDLSASVEVTPVFSLSLDNPDLSFGPVKSGETKVLGQEHYFNELRCRFNSGRPWYLKAQLLSLRGLRREYPLANSHLKWKVIGSMGYSEALAKDAFKEFSDQPVLIYSSQGDDNRGKEVILRFQYSLTIPLNAPADNYVGQVFFTMSENP